MGDSYEKYLENADQAIFQMNQIEEMFKSRNGANPAAATGPNPPIVEPDTYFDDVFSESERALPAKEISMEYGDTDFAQMLPKSVGTTERMNTNYSTSTRGDFTFFANRDIWFQGWVLLTNYYEDTQKLKYQWKIDDVASEWHEVELSRNKQYPGQFVQFDIFISDKFGIEPVKVSQNQKIQILVQNQMENSIKIDKFGQNSCQEESIIYNGMNGQLYSDNDGIYDSKVTFLA